MSDLFWLIDAKTARLGGVDRWFLDNLHLDPYLEEHNIALKYNVFNNILTFLEVAAQ